MRGQEAMQTIIEHPKKEKQNMLKHHDAMLRNKEGMQKMNF